MELAVDLADQCPVCESPLSRIKFAETQQKLRDREKGLIEDEKRRSAVELASLQEKFRQQLADARQAAAKEAREAASKELARVQAERSAAMQQVQKLQAREAQVRHQVQMQTEPRNQG